ncbi:MAG: YceI family protein [Ginsengibacter sp.]
MNCFIVTICSLIFSLPVVSQHYTPVDKGSKVHFTIRNFGISTGGDFSNLKGQITFDPQNTAVSFFNVTVDVNTIDTDSENRDEHLKSDNYFDVEKYPVISLKSTKIDATDKAGVFQLTGLLTIHGVTKQISFPFTATQQENDYLFAGNFELNRLDYSVGESSAIMSNTVNVSLSVLAKRD